MSSEVSPLAVEEYRALRATIRERGTARLIVTALTFVAWAGLVVAVQALFVVPVLALLPLVALSAGFEVVFAAHVGVERIGRYLQVRYEPSGTGLPGWEHAAMGLGTRAGVGGGVDPLFGGLFVVAALLNMVPVALMTLEGGPKLPGGVPLELVMYGGLHALFLARVVTARRFAANQRKQDFELFGGHGPTPPQ
jgi:hypothetical protein